MRMKSLSLAASIIVTATLYFGLASCKKEKIVEKVVEKVVTDTLYTQIPITAEILCADSLMDEEWRGVSGSSLVYYFRGGSSNTVNLDNEFIKFNPNNTGLYHENLGTERAITWNFINSAKTKIEIYFTNTPASFTVTWENFRVINGKFYLDEYYRDGNTNAYSHAQIIKIPKP